MDSSGRLHMPLPDGKEFVGETFEETGLKPNRHERRKSAAIEKKIFGSALPEAELMPTLDDLK